MAMKDPFSYSARWDSVGLDCSNCQHFEGPSTWPDRKKVSKCKLHHLSLALELGRDGYKQGEWFCKDFKDGGAFPKAVAEFNENLSKFEAGILYGAHQSSTLREIRFDEINKA